jgi:hypothetical protein
MYQKKLYEYFVQNAAYNLVSYPFSFTTRRPTKAQNGGDGARWRAAAEASGCAIARARGTARRCCVLSVEVAWCMVAAAEYSTVYCGSTLMLLMCCVVIISNLFTLS